LLGLTNSSEVFYTARNLTSSNAEAFLWPTPKSGAELYNDGIWVSFDSDGGGRHIYDDGAIVQFLKIEPADIPVTEELRILFMPFAPLTVPYKELAQFTVSVTDTNGQPVADVVTNLVTSVPGSTFAAGQFSYTVTNLAWVGVTNGIQFAASNSTVSTSAWMNVVVPVDSNGNGIPDVWERTYFDNYTNTAGGHADSDGVPNGNEYIANTDPTDPADFFQLTDIRVLASPAGRSIVCKTAPDRVYRIQFTDASLRGNPVPWTSFVGAGVWTNVSAVPSHTFSDDGTFNTSGTALSTQRTYRVWVGLP